MTAWSTRCYPKHAHLLLELAESSLLHMFACHVLCPADKPRGYAFIEYEHKKDMKEAYKQSDGRKIEGRRILVDVERGRTVENW